MLVLNVALGTTTIWHIIHVNQCAFGENWVCAACKFLKESELARKVSYFLPS